MKKLLLAIIIIIVLIFTTNVQGINVKQYGIPEKTIKISIDGVIIDTNEAKPYISDKTDSIMLPIRKINEALGYEVVWLDSSREVSLIINRGATVINVLLQLENNIYYDKNDLLIKNSYFEVINGRSYAPIDFFEKVLNVSIDFHENNGFAIINTFYKVSSLPNFQKDKIDDKDRRLWENSIKYYLADDLWTELYSYDAGHLLMVPMHAAFKYNEKEWLNQFANHFSRFVNEYNSNINNVVETRLNKLQYLYLASEFVVLCEKTNNRALIPSGLVSIINNEIKSIWEKEPAWQWGREPFNGGMRERLKWKLETKEVDISYYRAIIDEEFFTLAIGADLLTYENSVSGVVNNAKNFKNEIIYFAYDIFQQEGIWNRDGTWLFQPGVWSQHPDYAYVGNDQKGKNIKPSLIKNISMDTSHSHRFPLWINSFIEAFESFDYSKKDYFIKVRTGLEKQFYENVLVKPSKELDGYRTKNFMDGRNGVFRWNYPTQGQGNGYGPYELSGTLLIGWWSFLKSDRISDVYFEIAKFPLSEDVIQTYVGPNTSRTRHEIVNSPDIYYNGVSELITRLACKLY